MAESQKGVPETVCMAVINLMRGWNKIGKIYKQISIITLVKNVVFLT